MNPCVDGSSSTNVRIVVCYTVMENNVNFIIYECQRNPLIEAKAEIWPAKSGRLNGLCERKNIVDNVHLERNVKCPNVPIISYLRNKKQ